MAESIRDLLAAELKAIKARLEKPGTNEAKRLAAQFGERVKHLEERIAALPDPTPAAPQPPADKLKAG